MAANFACRLKYVLPAEKSLGSCAEYKRLRSDFEYYWRKYEFKRSIRPWFSFEFRGYCYSMSAYTGKVEARDLLRHIFDSVYGIDVGKSDYCPNFVPFPIKVYINATVEPEDLIDSRRFV